MTAQAVAAPTVSFPVDTAIGKYLRVKVSAGNLALAGAEDVEVGTVAQAIIVSGLGAMTKGPVLLRSSEGTVYGIASGSITAYAKVYGAASGKVSATANGNHLGIALEGASDGDRVEYLRQDGTPAKEAAIITTTDDTTLTAADSGNTYSTVGATGTVTFSLPAATEGLTYSFHVGAVQELRVDPDGTETAGLPSSGVQQAAGKYLTANAVGETLKIVCCDDGTWSPFGYSGTWTAEA